MITAKFTARNYRPENVKSRYVRFDGELYRFCEVGEDRRYDLRQGIVTADELPEDVKAAAMQRAGHFPSYVDWPLYRE